MKELISSKLNDLRHTGSKLIAVHLNKYCVITKKTPKEKNTTACIWNLWRNVIIERLLLPFRCLHNGEHPCSSIRKTDGATFKSRIRRPVLLKSARTLFDAQRPDGGAPNIFTLIALKSQLPFISHLASFLLPKALEDSFRFLYETSKALIKRRREEEHSIKHNDFLQLMLDLENENGSSQNATRSTVFSNNDLITHCITFLIAGYETTTSCLAYTSYLLAINPDVQEKLCQELDNYFKDHSISKGAYEATHDIEYLDMVVQESLRIFPPASLVVGRMSTENVQLGGLDIPKGTAVIVPVMSIHQDPKIWEDPMNFRPERFAAEEKEKRPQLCHLPFGWGPRNCIGMRFALMEIKMALISILQKYKFVQASETEVPLQNVVAGLTLQPKNGIYVKIQSRN